jgi:ribosome biogenesis GTPase
VAEESRSLYRLLSGDAEGWAEVSGALRHHSQGRSDLPAVGDWVLSTPLADTGQRAAIRRVLTRRTKFSRLQAPRDRPHSLAAVEQVVAANIDVVLLVTSLNQDFSLRRLERYLVLAWESGARPVVVLNKADLCDDPTPWRRNAESAALGVPVLVTSAVRGDGLEELRNLVRTSGTSALLGSSGVGKSTLINTLLREERLAAAPVREGDDRGRHTTTARQLLLVPGGGVVIDTPGMRELQLWDSGDGLEHAFADVEALAAGCRFADCRHEAEPGCAVRSAVAGGILGQDRLDSYFKLKREERFLETKTDLAARSERDRFWKQVARAQRQAYRQRGH